MIHHDFKIHPSSSMYSISLLLMAEQYSLVWIYHLLFNPSLLMRKWDLITQKNFLIGLSFLYTVMSSVFTAYFYCFDKHTQLWQLSPQLRCRIFPSPKKFLCAILQVTPSSLPGPGNLHGTLKTAWDSQDCRMMILLLNRRHLRFVHCCTCMRTLFLWIAAYYSNPTVAGSPYVSINSKVSSLLGALTQALLVSVSSHQFFMFLKAPSCWLSRAWLEHQMDDHSGHTSKRHTKDKAVILTKGRTLKSPGELK